MAASSSSSSSSSSTGLAPVSSTSAVGAAEPRPCPVLQGVARGALGGCRQLRRDGVSPAFVAAGATISVMVEIFSQTFRPSAFVLVGFLNWMGLFLLGMIFPFMVVRDWVLVRPLRARGSQSRQAWRPMLLSPSGISPIWAGWFGGGRVFFGL